MVLDLRRQPVVLFVESLYLRVHLEKLLFVLCLHGVHLSLEESLLLVNLLLEIVCPLEHLGLRLERLVLAVPDDVLLHLLKLEVSAATLIGTHEAHCLGKFGSFAFQEIWFTEQALEIAMFNAVGADLRVLGAIRAFGACQGLADAALSWIYRKVLAYTADKEIQLIWISVALFQ